MAKSPTITPEQCKQVLRYDPETGKLYWLERPIDMFNGLIESKGIAAAQKSRAIFNTRFSGKEAFTAFDGQGYRLGCIFGKTQRAHRVVWAIVHGYWPEQIDHINGKRDDNRIVNLRDVTNSENRKNMGLSRHNTSGVSGVFWNSQKQKWAAAIQDNYKSHHLGFFDTVESAAEARTRALSDMSFHHGHGARLSYRP